MRRQLGVLLLALLLPLAACSSDDGTGPDDDDEIEGTYALTTVNGSGLPFVLLDDATQGKVEIVSGSIVLTASGTFTDEIILRVTPVGGTATPELDRITGTFLHQSSTSTLHFTPGDGQGGGYEVAIVVGGLSARINAYTLLYAK